jgi:hypothetical protein
MVASWRKGSGSIAVGQGEVGTQAFGSAIRVKRRLTIGAELRGSERSAARGQFGYILPVGRRASKVLRRREGAGKWPEWLARCWSG